MLDASQKTVKPPTNTAGFTKPRSLDYAVILVLIAIALWIRLYLYRFHDVISTDGTGYVSAARKLMSGDVSGLSFYGFYPILVWLIGLIVPDMEIAAQLVSVFMGSLLVVPLYLLGLNLFSRTTAIVASIVTLVWSSHLSSSCIVASQATYTTLALAAIYLVWRMFKSHDSSHGYWAGFVMGLAFLTRPEAFLLFFVMPLALLVEKRRELDTVWRSVAGYCAVFTAILCMNTVLIHHFTGTWQLAAKTSSALTDTLSYYLKIPGLNQIPGVKPIGYLDLIRDYPNLILTNPINNLKTIFETILPAFFWLLAIVGFLAGGLQKKIFYNRLFLLCSFAPLGVIIVFYYISAGYVAPFLPILFLWCAEGGVSAERFITGLLPLRFRQSIEKFTKIPSVFLVASCVYSLIILLPQIPAKRDLSTYTWREDEGRRDHKRLGLILKQYLPPGKIMTRWARLAYYSDHEMVCIPNTDLPGIEKVATAGNARFLVLYGGLNGAGNQFDSLLEPLDKVPKVYFWITPDIPNKMPGLHKYLVYTNPSSHGLIVYEIIR